MVTKTWPFIVVLFLVPDVLGQADKPIQGTVVTQDGQPIEGVTVNGGGREQTTTDKAGAFRFQHPGTVIHFYKENLQPQLLVIQPGSSAVRITMNPAVTNAMSVPSCGRLQRGQKRIGWGRYGPQFTVSERSFDVRGGKPDVDYVRYVIKRKQSQSYMELWLGSTAISFDPDDDQFTASVEFVQRLVLSRNKMVGLDSSGHLRDGRSWRRTVIGGFGGAVYDKASSEDAASFDQVIDSMCLVPLPQASK